MIVGLASEDEYDSIAHVFEEQFYSTPFLEFCVEDACCKMGRNDLALMRMKKRYDEMINSDGAKETSTLWEHFRYREGTSNHGWGSGPVVILSEYVAGISPLEPGYLVYEAKPQLGELKTLETNVSTPYGEVLLKVDESKKKTQVISITQPKDISVQVAVKKMSKEPVIECNHHVIYKNGKPKHSWFSKDEVTYIGEDSEYVYFNAKAEGLLFESR